MQLKTERYAVQPETVMQIKSESACSLSGICREWWAGGDHTTLINRPRRFGKTLNMSMVEWFFSLGYAGKGEIFEGLSIWENEEYRNLQGTYPVISMSFAPIKEISYEAARGKICQMMIDLYGKYEFIKESGSLNKADIEFWDRVTIDMNDMTATLAIHKLSDFLCRYYGKKVIILLDEYDTPMQEAYVNGYWDEMVAFTRSMFNSMFKTNPYLERALMTGITRISKESIFSDLNHLEVVTTTSNKYATSFGFTEKEVFEALDEHGLGKEKEGVKYWYDGFVFGEYTDIYNPWSILNFLDKKGTYGLYWANTSGNRLIKKLLRESNGEIKEEFAQFLKGNVLECSIDEQIVYDQLDESEEAVWSLLVVSGYLKVLSCDSLELLERGEEGCYQLQLTNYEVILMFEKMVRSWFCVGTSGGYAERLQYYFQ